MVPDSGDLAPSGAPGGIQTAATGGRPCAASTSAKSTASQGDAYGRDEEPASYEPHQEATRVWEEVLEHAADRIDVSSLRVWFEGTTAVGLEADSLVVAVPSTFAEEYISTRFKDVLDEELRPVLSPTAEIRIVVGKVVEHV